MKFIATVTAFFQTLTTPHPMRDWYLLLAVAALVTVLLISMAVYFFFGIQSGFIIGSFTPEVVPRPTVSREALLETLETYEERRLNFEAGNYLVPNVSDPSE